MPPRPSILVRLAALGFVITSGITIAGSAQAPVIPSELFSDLRWQCIGPFDGGPVASVRGVAGVAGVYTITTPSGGAWKTTDGGDTWTPLQGDPIPLVGDPRQWVDPANPRRIARLASKGIEVSLDTGASWTAFQHLPIAEVARLPSHEHAVESPATVRRIDGTAATVSIADPARPGLIFAGTRGGVFVSFDSGGRWSPLRLNMPVVAINDLDVRGSDLIAATEGRSIWMLEDISPLRQLTAASASAAAWLAKPADTRAEAPALHFDYFLGHSASGPVTLDVVDATGRIVHHAQSTPADPSDRWLAVTRPIPSSPGHHRVTWDLRLDPPPSPHHRFAQFARPLFEDAPSEPEGPIVLAGTYQVRLTVAGHIYTQPLSVRNDPTASQADLQARRRQFDLAIKAYDAMQIAHAGFLQLSRVRTGLAPLIASTDAEIAAAAAAIDARAKVIDGSDWTGLVIPDADDESAEIDEAKEGKHPDFVPPKAVSLSKDYDDPTSILGRAFGNVGHAPAFAILGVTLGDVVTKAGRGAAPPDALALATYARNCEELAGVLDEWRAINTQDVPQLNALLERAGVPRLPVAATVPTIACAAK